MNRNPFFCLTHQLGKLIFFIIRDWCITRVLFILFGVWLWWDTWLSASMLLQPFQLGVVNLPIPCNFNCTQTPSPTLPGLHQEKAKDHLLRESAMNPFHCWPCRALFLPPENEPLLEQNPSLGSSPSSLSLNNTSVLVDPSVCGWTSVTCSLNSCF